MALSEAQKRLLTESVEAIAWESDKDGFLRGLAVLAVCVLMAGGRSLDEARLLVQRLEDGWVPNGPASE